MFSVLDVNGHDGDERSADTVYPQTKGQKILFTLHVFKGYHGQPHSQGLQWPLPFSCFLSPTNS